MKIIYCCFGGAHSSVTCASIHLGFLPTNRIPTTKEFHDVPFYDKMDNRELGTPVYVGRDAFCNDIFIMGAAGGRQIAVKAMYSYLNTYNISTREIMLVNALVELNPITSVGGFASRRLHLIKPGRPMTIWGIKRSYPMFVQLVGRVKAMIIDGTDFP